MTHPDHPLSAGLSSAAHPLHVPTLRGAALGSLLPATQDRDLRATQDREGSPGAKAMTRAATRKAGTRPVLSLPRELLAELEARVRDGYPFETCGLLIGHEDGARTDVVLHVQARNLAQDRLCDRYTVDPADQLAAENRAREAGLAVVGVWHSHPDHPALPSETDRAGAYEGYSYLILAVTVAGVEDARSWRLEGERFAEEDIQS